MVKWLLRHSILVVFISLMLGFKVTPRGRWDISRDEPTIWVKIDPEDLQEPLTRPETTDEDDPFFNYPASPILADMLTDVMNEINSLETSYLRLALYPSDPANPTNLPGDTPFSEDKAKGRTIDIVLSSQGSFVKNTGDALLDYESGKIVGCEWITNPVNLDNARLFRHIFMHELLHCLAVEHHHADKDAVMSYSNDYKNHKELGVDDRQALTYLYPLKDSYAEEQPTFGMSCEPR